MTPYMHMYLLALPTAENIFTFNSGYILTWGGGVIAYKCNNIEIRSFWAFGSCSIKIFTPGEVSAKKLAFVLSNTVFSFV